MFLAILQTMRPKQWTKNLFLFAGIIFSLHAFNTTMLLKVFAGFFLFCAVSGAIYILNDIVDLEKDRLHPKKSLRPLPSGTLSITTAWTAFALILSSAMGFALWLDGYFSIICISYFAMNLAYSFYLKRVVIIDVMIIAAGFVLRAVAGAVLIRVAISPWLLICTLFLALFLAFCKRRNEVMVMSKEGNDFREVLQYYSFEVLDQMIAVVTASSLMAYSFYTISDSVKAKFHTDYFYLTIPFVLFGIFRYLYLVHKENLGGNPEQILLKDIPMIIDISCWIVMVLILLYPD